MEYRGLHVEYVLHGGGMCEYTPDMSKAESQYRPTKKHEWCQPFSKQYSKDLKPAIKFIPKLKITKKLEFGKKNRKTSNQCWRVAVFADFTLLAIRVYLA